MDQIIVPGDSKGTSNTSKAGLAQPFSAASGNLSSPNVQPRNSVPLSSSNQLKTNPTPAGLHFREQQPGSNLEPAVLSVSPGKITPFAQHGDSSSTGAQGSTASVGADAPLGVGQPSMDGSQLAAHPPQPDSNGAAGPARPPTSQMAGLGVGKPISLPPMVSQVQPDLVSPIEILQLKSDMPKAKMKEQSLAPRQAMACYTIASDFLLCPGHAGLYFRSQWQTLSVYIESFFGHRSALRNCNLPSCSDNQGEDALTPGEEQKVSW